MTGLTSLRCIFRADTITDLPFFSSIASSRAVGSFNADWVLVIRRVRTMWYYVIILAHLDFAVDTVLKDSLAPSLVPAAAAEAMCNELNP